MNSPRITVVDEVNAVLSNIPHDDLMVIVEKMKIMDPSAFTTAAYRSRNWDGKIPMVTELGEFSLFQLDDVVTILASLDYNPDLITLEDLRNPIKHPSNLAETVEYDMFTELLGNDLWDHQYDGVKKLVQAEKGIYDAATSAGKTTVIGAIAKIYDPYYKSLTTTINESLAESAYKVLKNLGLDVYLMTAKTPVKKRQDIINTHRHIITTRKLAINCKTYFDGFDGVSIIDELHIFGDEFEKFCNDTISESPIRVGLTGTLPDAKKNKLKRQRILNVIGGDVVMEVLPGYLMDRGYAAKLDIRMVKIDDTVGREKMKTAGEKEWCWEMENAHYGNEERAEAIANFIMKNCPRNLLVIAAPEVGIKIANFLGCDFIDKDTKKAIRDNCHQMFDKRDDYKLVATPGTSGVGLSIDLIHYGVVVDIGENPAKAGQAVGRFMRKDTAGELKDSCVVFDIYSNTKYGMRQAAGRRKYYKERGFTFIPDYDIIKA